jgi:hypothetical protein
MSGENNQHPPFIPVPGLRVVALVDIVDQNGNTIKTGAAGVVISQLNNMIEVDFGNNTTWGVFPHEVTPTADQTIQMPGMGDGHVSREVSPTEKELQISMLRMSQNISFLRQHAIDFYSTSLLATEIIEDLEAERDELERQLNEAQEALRFYADYHAYTSKEMPFYGRNSSLVEEDNGKRARTALAGQRKRYAPRLT